MRRRLRRHGAAKNRNAPDAAQALFDEAVRAAAAADVAVLFLGTNEKTAREGADRTEIDLPGAQAALFAAVRRAARRVVVVLVNGTPLAIDAWVDAADAVVEGSPPSAAS